MQRRNLLKMLFGIGIASATPVAVESAQISNDKKEQLVAGYGDEACKLVKCLGLNPKYTRSVRLNIDIDEAVSVDVKQYVTDAQLRQIAAVVKRKYYLGKKVQKDELILN